VSSNPNSTLGSLKTAHPQELECSVAQGMQLREPSRHTLLESQSNLETLRERLSNRTESNGWSVSVWFTSPLLPSDYVDRILEPILTLGLSDSINETDGDNNTTTSFFSGGCGGYYFQLAQYQQHLVVSFQDTDAAQSCRILVVRGVPLQGNVAATVTFSETTTSIYLNDRAILTDIPYVADAAGWTQASQSTLQLFSSSHPSTTITPTMPFQGSIQQVSLFDEALTPEEVAQVVHQGVVYAEPSQIVLLGEPSPDVVLAQDDGLEKRTMFWLGSANASTTFLPLALQVITLPSRGKVSLQGHAEPLSELTNVSSSSSSSSSNYILVPLAVNSTGVWMEYRLTASDYFTVPSVDAHGNDLSLPAESFEYRVVTVSDPTEPMALSPLATSPRVTQVIQVQHVNHRPIWNVPQQAKASVVEGLPNVYLGQLQLLDPLDRNVDRVRVDLWALQGYLTLDPDHVHLADFKSCAQRVYSDWQCVGNGVEDRRMTFLAVPDDVERILANLVYEGFVPGDSDQVGLLAYDGTGGACLDPKEHARGGGTLNWATEATIHRECFQVQVTIQIPAVQLVLQPNDSDEESGIFGIPNTNLTSFGTADLLFWVALISVLVTCFTCLRQCCPNCLARGAGIVPEDYDSEEEEIESTV
jgi:hypothetical protein